MLIDEIRKANIAAMKAHDTEARGAYSIVITRYQALLTSGTGVAPTDADQSFSLQRSLGAWFSGRTEVSKTFDEGSIPSAPAICRLQS